jgi:hypothetical protein
LFIGVSRAISAPGNNIHKFKIIIYVAFIHY